jgi:two-component system cell cycle sensor histidine kinase/response regulator CckA
MSTSTETGSAPTILLVDDDDMLRRLLSRVLREEGLRVLEAGNGDIALKVARGLTRPPTVVLTDVAMPVMDGFRFARIFRSLYPSVPILFMSGGLPQGPGSTLPYTGAGLLLKPFRNEALLETVAAVIEVNPLRSSGGAPSSSAARTPQDREE